MLKKTNYLLILTLMLSSFGIMYFQYENKKPSQVSGLYIVIILLLNTLWISWSLLSVKNQKVLTNKDKS
jgi:hypothetical protein